LRWLRAVDQFTNAERRRVRRHLWSPMTRAIPLFVVQRHAKD